VAAGSTRAWLAPAPRRLSYPGLLAIVECALALAGYAALGPYLALRHSFKAATVRPGPTPPHHP
jgi:hypothetical protein